MGSERAQVLGALTEPEAVSRQAPASTIAGAHPSAESCYSYTRKSRADSDPAVYVRPSLWSTFPPQSSKVLQDKHQWFTLLGFLVAGNTGSGLRACVPTVLTENGIFKWSHLLSYPGESE